MKIIYWGEWEKYFSKISRYHKTITNDAVEFFLENPYHPSLRNHPLDPPLEKYRTLSVDDDLRILFRMMSSEKAFFLKIWRHNEIYRKIEL